MGRPSSPIPHRRQAGPHLLPPFSSPYWWVGGPSPHSFLRDILPGHGASLTQEEHCSVVTLFHHLLATLHLHCCLPCIHFPTLPL